MPLDHIEPVLTARREANPASVGERTIQAGTLCANFCYLTRGFRRRLDDAADIAQARFIPADLNSIILAKAQSLGCKLN